MRTEWDTVSLDQVLDFFAKAYQLRRDEKLVSFKAWVDAAKKEVVFRLDITKEIEHDRP